MSNNELQLQTGPYKTTFVGTEILRKSTKKEWENYGEILRRVDEAKQWAIGDWLVDGKSHYGDGLYDRASEILGYDAGKLRQFASMADRFELLRRRNNLTWGHHYEVSVIRKVTKDKRGKISWDKEEHDIDKAQELLKLAEKEKLSIRDLRDKVTEYKNLQEEIMRLANEPEKYSLIYADPPWQYDNTGFEMSAANQYPTMSIDELCKMPISHMATSDAVLLMWVTNPILYECRPVIESWGFDYKTNFVWVKDNHTAGFYVFGQHELLLVCTRGDGNLPDEKFKSIIHGKNDVHSKKPESVYDMINQMYPNRKYLELFARNKRAGWESFGNEI